MDKDVKEELKNAAKEVFLAVIAVGGFFVFVMGWMLLQL